MQAALSRDSNKECILFGFYDTHDTWHFLSALWLFFSAVLILTLDDNLDHVLRSKISSF
jgi:hypothetical protein